MGQHQQSLTLNRPSLASQQLLCMSAQQHPYAALAHRRNQATHALFICKPAWQPCLKSKRALICVSMQCHIQFWS